MPRYIDADKLLEQVNSLEQLARKRVADTPTTALHTKDIRLNMQRE